MQTPLQTTYPKPAPQIKAIREREQRIEAAVIRLKILPVEMRGFLTVAQYLDFFLWGGQPVDLREGR